MLPAHLAENIRKCARHRDAPGVAITLRLGSSEGEMLEVEAITTGFARVPSAKPHRRGGLRATRPARELPDVVLTHGASVRAATVTRAEGEKEKKKAVIKIGY